MAGVAGTEAQRLDRWLNTPLLLLHQLTSLRANTLLIDLVRLVWTIGNVTRRVTLGESALPLVTLVY